MINPDTLRTLVIDIDSNHPGKQVAAQAPDTANDLYLRPRDYFEARMSEMFHSETRKVASDATSEMALDARVNACDLACPLPLLKAKMALNDLQVGQLLEVLATDKGSVRDFQSFCTLSAHELVVSDSQEGCYRYIIRKG